MEDMDLSEDVDLEEILFLLEDNVLVRWRIEYNFFNQSIYGRLFERGNRFGDHRNMKLPEIKGPPNTAKLLKTGFYQKVRAATTSPPQPLTSAATPLQPSLRTIRRRPHTSLVHLLHQREHSVWRSSTKCFANNIFLPNSLKGCVPSDDKVKYCAVYSPDNGRHLLVASVDGHVTIYDSETRSQVARYYLDQNTYAPLDLDVSPDGREFLVSTWRNNVFTCNILEDDINRNYFRSHQLMDTNNKMGAFSACFSNDATEILASSNDGCIYLYDRTRDERSQRIVQDLRGDINAVRFLDPASNNVIVGGSDNGIIEIWDRRVLGTYAKTRKSVATLVGHHDGITYIDAKGDGRYFISNSKDQAVKLWDVRKVGRPHQVKKTRKLLAQPATWNYHNDTIPEEYYGAKKPLDGDCSVMTYRGHRVAKTLIRAKFSPTETTGNRFIYSGCATGRVIIYDTLTGKMSGHLEGHTELVRDVSWHPLRNEIASASFDEKVNINVYTEKMDKTANEPFRRRSRRIAAKRARDSN